MLIFVENQSQEAQTPEIWETDDEKVLPIGGLKDKYVDFAFKRFVHNPPLIVTNKETGWPIEFSSRVIKEWRAKSRTRERIIAIQLLGMMVERAKYLETVKDSKNTSGIDDVSYFENLCRINGKPFKINITVKRQAARRFAYYYSAISIESK
jgi:hypothetical protein